jgi:hypothetical protein
VRRISKTFALLALSFSLSACAAVSGYPDPILSEQQETEEIAAYLQASAIKGYEACPDKVHCRNMIVDARVRAVDLAFHRFQRKIYGQNSRVTFGTNVASLALDSAATITQLGGLATGAGLLSGGRDVYQKQALTVSMPLLFDQMAAKRAEILLRIRQGQRLPANSYSLFQALSDVSEYEMVGSIPAAAAELGASTGEAARLAQLKLDALRASALAAAPTVASAVTSATTTPMPAVAVSAGVPATTTAATSPGTASAALVVGASGGMAP